MTYNASLPTDRDKARALLGDTSNDVSTELISDTHIDAVFSLYPVFNRATAFLAEELAVRFAREPDTVTVPGPLGSMTVSWRDRVQTWKDLAQKLRDGQIGAISVLPYAGGLSIVDKETLENDTDRVLPAFVREDFDEKEARRADQYGYSR